MTAPTTDSSISAHGPADTAAPAVSAPAAGTRTLTACTVATGGDDAAVRALADSFAAHNPGVPLVVLRSCGDGDLSPAAVGCDDEHLARLVTATTPGQLRDALAPLLLRTMLAGTGGPVLYLAPHVLVCGPVAAPVTELLGQRPVVLAARVADALPDDGDQPAAADLAAAGPVDLSMVAVAPGAEPFLALWAGQLGEQGAWTSQIPAVVDHHVLRDPGFGVSSWNAHTRPVELTVDLPAVPADEAPPTGDRPANHTAPEPAGQPDGTSGPVARLTVGSGPLRTVHLEGFDPEVPWLLDARLSQPRVRLSDQPALAGLVRRHGEALRGQAARARTAPLPGPALPATLRAEYRRAWRRGHPPPAAGPGPRPSPAFLRWAAEPVPGGGTRWSDALHADTEVLRRRFPDPSGTAYRHWCATEGVDSGLLPDEAVPAAPPPLRRKPLPHPGLSVLGPDDHPLLGPLRSAARACGLPTASDPAFAVTVLADPAALPEELRGTRCVVLVTASGLLGGGVLAGGVLGGGLLGGGLLGGGVPAGGVLADGVDEIWVPTEASRRAVEAGVGVPVRQLALPIGGRPGADRGASAGPAVGPTVGVVAVLVGDTGAPVELARLWAAGARQVLLVPVGPAAADATGIERLRLAVGADPRVRVLTGGLAGLFGMSGEPAVVVLGEHADDHAVLAATEAAAAGVPVAGNTLDGALPVVRELSSLLADPAAAAAEAATTAARLARERGPAAVGERLRELTLAAHERWLRARAAEQVDPLEPLRRARRAIRTVPDVGQESRVPLAPALRKAVLRVLHHHDAHQRDVLRSLLDGVERTAAELVRRSELVRHTPPPAPLPSADETGPVTTELLTRLAERDAVVDELARQLRATRDDASRLALQVAELTTDAEDTRGRLDELERRLTETRSDDRLAATVADTRGTAERALRAADAVGRVLLRDRERATAAVAAAGGRVAEGDAVLCDAGVLRLPPDDLLMLPWLSSHGSWERPVAELIDSLLEPGGIFVDIGAHVGYHALRALQLLGAAGTVVAVEPDPALRDLLAENVGSNVVDAVAARLVLLPYAAWDAPGPLPAVPAPFGGLTVRPGAEPGEAAETVTGVRLDRELEGMTTLRGQRLSVVKVDTGGQDHRALAGLARLLRRDRPHVVCTFSGPGAAELGDNPEAVLREYRVWGYELWPLGGPAPLDDAAIIADTRNGSIPLHLRPR